MQKQMLISVEKVSGKSAGSATVTEDGGFAKNYAKLTEVTTKTGHITDAYYFVEPSNADSFISKLERDE